MTISEGELRLKFAWLPVKTVSGKRVWLKNVYAQDWFPVLGPGLMGGTKYYTPKEAVIKSLSSDQ